MESFLISQGELIKQDAEILQPAGSNLYLALEFRWIL